MPRIVRWILILIPLGLIAATVAVWLGNQLRSTTEPTPDAVGIQTHSVDGITFEVEHEPQERVKLFGGSGPHEIRLLRGGDILDYSHGLLSINDIGLPDVKPGDTVRWNLSGPVQINGQSMLPHPMQARSLEAENIDAQWKPLESPYPRDTLSIAWAGTTRRLVAGHGDGAIRVWDVDKHEVVKTLIPDPPKTGGRGGYGLRIAVSPDGKQIAACNLFGEEVALWDLEAGTKTASFTEPKGEVNQVAFADDKTLLEARGEKLLMRLLSGSGITELGAVHEQSEPPFALHSTAGLVAWSDGKVLRFGPLAKATFEHSPVSAGCFAFSPDGSLLAVFDGDNRLSLLDVKTGTEVKRLRWRGRLGAADGINALAFAPDGRTLAVGSSDSIRFYDLPTGRERGGLASPWVRCLAYSADGRTLAAGLRYQPGLRLWNTADLVAK
jgi:WD40 repeat protein